MTKGPTIPNEQRNIWIQAWFKNSCLWNWINLSWSWDLILGLLTRCKRWIGCWGNLWFRHLTVWNATKHNTYKVDVEIAGGEGTCYNFEALATADVDRSGASSFDPQFSLHFTLRTPTQNFFFSSHKNWVKDCGCKIASTNQEKSRKNLQPNSTIVVSDGKGVVSSSRSCLDLQHFFLSLPTTLQHPLFLEFWNPLGRTRFKVGWEKQKHKKVTYTHHIVTPLP